MNTYLQSVSSRSFNRDTATWVLLGAAKAGDLALVQRALEMGSDVDCRDMVGPLKNDPVDLRAIACNLSVLLQDGRTPLMLSVMGSLSDCVEALLEAGAAVDLDDQV